MKITGKRKGFSTNSSSAFEWIPPEATATAAGTASTAGNNNPTPPPVSTVSRATAPGFTMPPSLRQHSPAPENTTLLNVGILCAIIIGLFVIEEAIRKIWKKLRKKKHEE